MLPSSQVATAAPSTWTADGRYKINLYPVDYSYIAISIDSSYIHL